MSARLVVTLALVFVGACTKSRAVARDATAPDDADTADSGAAEAALEPGYDVCALLPTDALAALFPELRGKSFQTRDGREPQAPPPKLGDLVREADARGLGARCRYGFPKQDAAKLEARLAADRRKLVLERIEARRRADGGPLPRLSEALGELPRARVEITLTMAGRAPFASDAEAEASFEARRSMRDAGDEGLDGGAEGIADLGDAAEYRGGVLHVRSGRHVFALEVRDAPERDRETAIALARVVLSKVSRS